MEDLSSFTDPLLAKLDSVETLVTNFFERMFVFSLSPSPSPSPLLTLSSPINILIKRGEGLEVPFPSHEAAEKYAEIVKELEELERMISQVHLSMVGRSVADKKPFVKIVEEREKITEQLQREYARIKENVALASSFAPNLSK